MKFESMNLHVNNSIQKSAEGKFELQDKRDERKELIDLYRRLRANQRFNGMDLNSAKAREQIAPLLEQMAQTSEELGTVRDEGGYKIDRVKVLEERLNRLDEIDIMNNEEFIETPSGKEFFAILDEYGKLTQEKEALMSQNQYNTPEYFKVSDQINELCSKIDEIEKSTPEAARFSERRKKIDSLRGKVDLRLRQAKSPEWEEGEELKEAA